jgi:hypothetical protein
MKNKPKKSDGELTKGQVWRTAEAYLQIMDRGKRLISYKMMKERGKKAVMTQMSAIATVEEYLKANKAELIDTDFTGSPPSRGKFQHGWRAANGTGAMISEPGN